MKIRVTPLNVVSALFLILAVYVWIYGAATVGMKVRELGTAIGWIFLFFAFAVSFLDVMLRNFSRKPKKYGL